MRKPPRAASEGGEAPEQAQHEISCADILFALEEQPAGLTPALLARFVSAHGSDRSSEASYVIV